MRAPVAVAAVSLLILAATPADAGLGGLISAGARATARGAAPAARGTGAAARGVPVTPAGIPSVVVPRGLPRAAGSDR